MNKPATFFGLIIGIALAFATLPTTSHAQKMVMELDGDSIEGQPYIIAELGAVVVFKNKRLEIMHVMDKHARPKEYLSVDVQAGDRFVMFNGTRLKTLEDLKGAFENAKVGQKLKFGIKRDKGMHMISFAKADPESLPQMSGMTMTIDDDGPDSEDGADGDVNFNFQGEVAMLMGSGIIANETDAGILIGALMPGAQKRFGKVDISKGDRIIKLQGKKITALSQLSELYDKIEVGGSVEFVLANEEGEYTVTFKKRDTQDGPIIKTITN